MAKYKEFTPEVGDTIVSRGVAMEIGEVLSYDFYGEDEGSFVEFKDKNGEYSTWEQKKDGGEIIKAKRETTSNKRNKEDKKMSNVELIRANKVTVKSEENGYVADFYRTHKKIKSVPSVDTDWVAPEGITKTGERESYRAYIVEHANEYGINWMPQDLRTEGNVRKAKYATDDEVFEDAVAMISPTLIELTDKCKYPLKWKGLEFDSITPMTHTGKGTPLDSLGVEGGKYAKSGNWAWANVVLSMTLEYNGQEIYDLITVELVSGQLKKPKMTITSFTETVKSNIIAAGLATAEELDPPKEKKSKKADETPAEEPAQGNGEEKPKRGRRRTADKKTDKKSK